MVETCVIICVIELIILLHILYIINYKQITPYIKENFYFKPNCVDPKLLEIKEKLMPMFADDVVYDGILANINKKRIKNDISLCKGDKSYTINKEDIYICLKDEHGNYYDDNMLVYVAAHELSHSICKSIGHTQEFHEIFEAFLKKAIEMNIYDPKIPIIQNYCTYIDKK